MSLTVKAYLKKPGGGADPYEIRRFAVDHEVSSSYNYLISKITTVFPGLANKTLLLSWKDVDNDKIAFSSDEELTEALGFVTDGVFKVYVEEKVQPPVTGGSHTDGMVLHHGVICDGCDGPVYGIRHKCTICPDYDLCMNCKGMGLHSEHGMFAIENPRIPEFIPPFMMGPHCGMMPPPPPVFGFHPQPSGAAGPPPPPPCFAQKPSGTPHDRRMIRRAWRRWWKTTYGGDPWKKCKKEKKEEKKEDKKDEKKEKQEKKEKKKAEKMAESGAAKPENDSSSSSSSDDEGESSPNEKYLKSVGESVAAMLDPLGIDVEVDVDHRGQRRRCHRGGPWGWGMHGQGHHGQGRGCFGGPWGRRGGSMGSGTCPWKPVPSTCSFPAPRPMGQNPQAQQQQDPSTGHRDIDTNSETGEQRSGMQTPMASGSFGKSGEPFEGNGWTIVPGYLEEDIDGATKGVEQLNVSGETPPAYRPAPEDYASDDPLLAAAVADMKRMGFSDDGGWLTALLTAYNCDIGRALDAINSKK